MGIAVDDMNVATYLMAMSKPPFSTLHSTPVAAVLDELFADAARVDPEVLAPFAKLPPEAQMAMLRDYRRVYAEAKSAYLPVSRRVGELLYLQARARSARYIVEFGTSFGISTLHLAAALRDNLLSNPGAGRLVTSEIEPEKAARARSNLERAGLADLVEIRVGDALETLADLPAGIDFVLLDGAKTLYLPVLGLLEPKLADRAVIVADNVDMVDLVHDYVEHVNDSANGYLTSRIQFDDGLDLSIRLAS